jgi:hypothetical protein
MGRKTSIYLDDELDQMIKDSGKTPVEFFKGLLNDKNGFCDQADSVDEICPVRPFNLRSALDGELCADASHDFFIHGFERGTVGILSGEGGMGKSMLAISLALQAVTGLNLSGYPIHSSKRNGKVVYFTCEESASIIASRMVAYTKHAGQQAFQDGRADFLKNLIDNRLKLIDLSYGGSNIFDGVFESYLDTLDGDIDLIVIDTFSDIHELDENSAKDMNRVMRRLNHLAKQFNACVLILHHTNKPAAFTGQNNRSARMQSSVRGSSVIVNKSKFFIRLSDVEKGDIKLTRKESLDDYVYASFGGNYVEDSHIIYKRGMKGVLLPAKVGESALKMHESVLFEESFEESHDNDDFLDNLVEELD